VRGSGNGWRNTATHGDEQQRGRILSHPPRTHTRWFSYTLITSGLRQAHTAQTRSSPAVRLHIRPAPDTHSPNPLYACCTPSHPACARHTQPKPALRLLYAFPLPDLQYPAISPPALEPLTNTLDSPHKSPFPCGPPRPPRAPPRFFQGLLTATPRCSPTSVHTHSLSPGPARRSSRSRS
jgi:hypothetical protein